VTKGVLGSIGDRGAESIEINIQKSRYFDHVFAIYFDGRELFSMSSFMLGADELLPDFSTWIAKLTSVPCCDLFLNAKMFGVFPASTSGNPLDQRWRVFNPVRRQFICP